MDVFHGLLAVVALAAAGGVVWLLIRRGAEGARLAAAEEGARAERERREQLEGAHAALGGQLELARTRVAEAQSQAASLTAQIEAAEDAMRAAVGAERTLADQRLREKEQVFEAQRKALEESKQEITAKLAAFDAKMKESFGALAGEALSKSNTEFLRLAEERLKTEREKTTGEVRKDKAAIEALIEPIRETLKKTDEKLGLVQQQWATDRGSLTEQLRAMGAAGETLRAETGKLVKALSRPEVRGRYGEIQLRRVAELAGMSAYCDFGEQETMRDEDNRATRPDMVVRLPNERVIAVDAKTNTFSYVEAVNATTPEEQDGHLERFARHVQEQVLALSKKQYWSRFDASPDFVVMFMPGDQFLDAALVRRPELIEQAAAANVLLATPSTLIGLLRAVAVGWREKRLDEQAKELFELGRQLHERAAVAFEKLARVGEAIETASKRYNEFVGSYESRLDPTLRKFEEAGVKSAKELPVFEQVEVRVRQLPGTAATEGESR